MPYLSVAKRGFTSKFDLLEIVNAILYKLKSGCQWRFLRIRPKKVDLIIKNLLKNKSE